MRWDGRTWATAAGALLTIAMVAGLARQLAAGGLSRLGDLSVGPAFLAAVLALYLVPPLADWLIFRRLWQVCAGAGLGRACLKKRIANEVVLGYSGDAYLYAWARANAVAGAPFAAVKDVAVLSALAGNLSTLAALALALPFAGGEVRLLAGSAAVLVGMTLPFLLWRRRVLSLPRTTLWRVFGVHVGRIALTTSLAAFAWALAVPGIAVGTWALLAAGRLLVTRLPLVPNKELLFANLAMLWVGRADEVTAAIALVATLTLAAHGAAMLLLGARGALRLLRR